MIDVTKLQQDITRYLTLSDSEKQVFMRQQQDAIAAMTPDERRLQVEAIQQRVHQLAEQLEDRKQPVK